MSVTYADPTKPSHAQEILDDDSIEIAPAPQGHGPVTPERQPSDGELLARAEG